MKHLWAMLVRFGFRLLYHEMAWSYDLVSRIVSFGQWRAWTRSALDHLATKPSEVVLEIAHGTGNLQLDLCAQGYTVFGLDLSPQMGRIAMRKLEKSGFRSWLVRGSALSLPFADGNIGAIVCTFPTPFILQSSTLTEAWRVLKPGGRFVIVANAVLVGGDAGTATLEWLYRVTGQRGGDGLDMQSFFSRFGFAAQLINRPQHRSIVTLIVAEKMVHDPSQQ